MSLDGFVAGPGHDMSWPTGSTVRDGLIQEYVDTTGAVLAGRDGFDSAIGDARPYGGAWQGPVFILTHHPDDARPEEGVAILSCPVEEAVRIALDAAVGKNVEGFSPTIGGQLLERGLIDEIDLHIARSCSAEVCGCTTVRPARPCDCTSSTTVIRPRW